MARIGTVALTTSESDIFNSTTEGAGIVAFVIRNPSTNSATVSIRSESMGHEVGQYWTLAPGESVELVNRRPGIRRVTGLASANCNVDVLSRIV